MRELRSQNIPMLINTHLGNRPPQAKYSFSDIILSWVYCNFCGNDSIESSKRLKIPFSEMPDYKHPSPDRIGDIIKSFATPNTCYSLLGEKETDKLHYFNINMPLN